MSDFSLPGAGLALRVRLVVHSSLVLNGLEASGLSAAHHR